jgi:hypothetical protein
VLVCSSTACISSHLFVVVPADVRVLNIVAVYEVVGPVETPCPGVVEPAKVVKIEEAVETPCPGVVEAVETPCPGVVEPLDNPV